MRVRLTKSLIIPITLFILLFLALKSYQSHLGPNAVNLNKGYGMESESVSTLLDRIEWVNRYKGRNAIEVRYLIYAIPLALFILAVVDYSLHTSILRTKPILLVQVSFLIFLYLVSLGRFYDHHVDKYAHYYIHNNIEMLKGKLGLGEGDVGDGGGERDRREMDTNINNTPLTDDCHNFVL